MRAQELMTRDPACCTPDDSVQEAARLMAENDCGCLPVVDDRGSRQLRGVVTDRDLAVRGLAQGKGRDTRVSDIMSDDPSCCSPDSDVAEVERIMAERKVRRVPVIDGSGCCVGMVSQADIARAAERGNAVSDLDVARVVERVSEPSGQPRSEAKVGVSPGEQETRL